MAAVDILALGEAMIEFNQTGGEGGRLYLQGFGGDSSNFAISAARQGARVGYLSAVGDDSYGAMLRELWKERRRRRQRRDHRWRPPSRRSTSSPTMPPATTSASSAAARRRAGSRRRSCRARRSPPRACCICRESRSRSRRSRSRPDSPRSRSPAAPASGSRSTPTCALKLWPIERGAGGHRRGRSPAPTSACRATTTSRC